LDIIAEAHWRKGSKAPIEDAIKEVAEIHEKRAVETVSRSYKAGLAKMAPFYADFADWVNGMLAKRGLGIAHHSAKITLFDLNRPRRRRGLFSRFATHTAFNAATLSRSLKSRSRSCGTPISPGCSAFITGARHDRAPHPGTRRGQDFQPPVEAPSRARVEGSRDVRSPGLG
jgi:hypothetical protein